MTDTYIIKFLNRVDCLATGSFKIFNFKFYFGLCILKNGSNTLTDLKKCMVLQFVNSIQESYLFNSSHNKSALAELHRIRTGKSLLL